MDFYEDIAHRLYVWNTKINGIKIDPFEFIEEKHKEAPHKGKIFYLGLVQAMPNHFGAKTRPEFFKEILRYCKKKIREIKKAQKLAETKAEITNSDTAPTQAKAKPDIKEPIKPQITVASYAIMHRYWSVHDKTKAITETNAKMWAEKYKCSHNTLLRFFKDYDKRVEKIWIANSRDNINSVREQIKRFENFLPLLETLCPKAFQDAKKGLESLKKDCQ